MAPEVTERDHAAAAVVLPEFEERLKNAHSRAASPGVINSIQRDYDDARYAEVDADADDGDELDNLSKAELVALADEHDVSLDGARTNADRADRLRAAGVSTE
jgi:hypothetical protein